MPRILVTPPELVYKDGPCQKILGAAGMEVVYPPRGMQLNTPQRLLEHLAGVEGMLASSERLSADILGQCGLRAIARAGVGYDAIDIAAATRHEVAVTITPGTNQVSVAEQMLAMLLGVMRGYPRRDMTVRDGTWHRMGRTPRVAGKTLGLIGMGRIGKAIVPRAQALGLKILVHDPLADREFAAANQVQLVSLDQLLRESNIVSLHLPRTAETENIIDGAALAKMPRGSVLINTARGGLVDEEALADALESGHLWGAGLDVFATEPPPRDLRLLKMDNVMLCPHMAGLDDASIEAMERLAAECLVSLYRTGTAPEGCLVTPKPGSGWKWAR
jgi:D-3-phosphoglycerate dehydrogenase / 2-oxoglutarate reductase